MNIDYILCLLMDVFEIYVFADFLSSCINC
jgi:hypothetical protein